MLRKILHKIRNPMKSLKKETVPQKWQDFELLEHQIGDLDETLRLQNLRRREEEKNPFPRKTFVESPMVRGRLILWLSGWMMLLPSEVLAASFEGSLDSLVNAVVGRIMPILATPFVARTAFGYVRGDREAIEQTPKVALGVVALLGINGLLKFLKDQVK